MEQGRIIYVFEAWKLIQNFNIAQKKMIWPSFIERVLLGTTPLGIL